MSLKINKREYTRKLQQCLIDTGRTVEQQEHQKTPSMELLKFLFDSLDMAIEINDMKAQSVASGELIAGLVKWRIEKM